MPQPTLAIIKKNLKLKLMTRDRYTSVELLN